MDCVSAHLIQAKNMVVAVFIHFSLLSIIGAGEFKMIRLNIERLLDEGKLREPFSAGSVQKAMPELTKEEIGTFLRRNCGSHRHRFIKVFRGWYRCNRDAAASKINKRSL